MVVAHVDEAAQTYAQGSQHPSLGAAQQAYRREGIKPQYLLVLIGNDFVNKGQRRAHYRLRVDRGCNPDFNGVSLLEDMERRLKVNNINAASKNQEYEPLGRTLVGEREDWVTEPSHGVLLEQ